MKFGEQWRGAVRDRRTHQRQVLAACICAGNRVVARVPFEPGEGLE